MAASNPQAVSGQSSGSLGPNPDSSITPSLLTARDLQAVLDALSVGMIVFALEPPRVLLANQAAVNHLDPTQAVGQWSPQLAEALKSRGESRFDALKYDGDGRKNAMRIAVQALPLEGRTAGLILLDDPGPQSILEERLARAERLAEVGQTAVRAVHDLNNPLDGILRYINLAIRVIEEGQHDRAQAYLVQSRDGLMRMVGILQEVLGFARAARPGPRRLSVCEAAEEAVSLFRATAPDVDMHVIDRAQDDRYWPGEVLMQVFCNLTKNAVDAMEGDGRLAVEIDAEGSWLRIVFRDTGPGFDPAEAEHLFEPFFTTKPQGRGTGLGLAICRDLLHRLGGRIEAANDPQGGCRVTVRLPRDDDSPQPAHPQEGPA